MPKKILVATDGSAHAKKAIGHASDIAAKYNAALYLIHVVSTLHAASMSPREYDEATIEALINQMRRAGETIIREAEAEARGKGVRVVETLLTEGDPTNEILRSAREHDVDMIVMGSRGVGSVETFLLGSVSHRVCHSAECTCVTVK